MNVKRIKRVSFLLKEKVYSKNIGGVKIKLLSKNSAGNGSKQATVLLKMKRKDSQFSEE